ncbi:MAG TPA: hypothetical protein VFT80_08875 [Actinomycetota bacterium]|nr:hypothetical protein [Actinomycetota bacterium]
MSTRAGLLWPPRRAAHPRTHRVVEVALVIAIAVSAIGVLATLRDTPAGKTGGLAATQERVDAASRPWRAFKESQASFGTPEGRLADIRVQANATSLAWRALKEGQAPATALDLRTGFQVPAANAGPLGWRSYKEMTSREMTGGR